MWSIFDFRRRKHSYSLPKLRAAFTNLVIRVHQAFLSKHLPRSRSSYRSIKQVNSQEDRFTMITYFTFHRLHIYVGKFPCRAD